MDNGIVQLVGGPCGQHGPYTFYKAFTYAKDGVKRVITLSEFFFVKLWMDSDLLCIGELQMLWMDKNSEQVLASLRLYFLPENTPEGRMDHGEDEVLAISEKVVLRVEDLITWVTIDAEWTWGRLGKTVHTKQEVKSEGVNCSSLSEALREITDLQCGKTNLESKCNNNDKAPSVVILSYPRYCRYRAMMRRLEGMEDTFLRMKIVTDLGGFSVPSENTRILFCKDTFDYPELEGHELLCNHLAPKLKGRPRGKRKKRSISPGSESNESECSLYGANLSQPSTSGIKSYSGDYPNGATPGSISTRRSTRSSDNSEGKAFVKKLTSFMKSNHSPIGRIPSLGYKELDLHHFFTKVQKLGGYDVVTSSRIWKSIFEELGGSHASTSAATVMRRHYERFLLPYERHVKGEEYKPLPVSARRRLKSKASRTSTSDADTSEGTSGSENSTPAPCSSNNVRSDMSSTEIKEAISEKGKTSSLRSVRVKSERAREARREAAEREQKETPDPDSPTTPTTPTTPVQTTPKGEPIELKEEPQNPVIDNEPITTAATPNSKHVPDKSPSPIESKEIPPNFDLQNKKTKDEQKAEVIDLDSDVYKNISSNNNNNNIDRGITEEVIVDVKKGKLDILKQGGLEVTPVRRPSVIQQIPVIQHRVEIIPNSKALNDRKSMPPPLTVKKLEQSPEKKFISNGRNFPKVVQSKSIYVPSEKTIYGDPKDFQLTTIQQIQAPISLTSRNPTTGGGILDLTVKSPQKPQISNYPLGLSQSDFYSRSFVRNPPKMNSNLEITLVKNEKSPVFHKPAIPRKRSFSGSNHQAKIPRMDEKASIPPQRNFQVPQAPQPLLYGQNFSNSGNKLPPYFPSSMDLYQNMLNMYLPAMYRMQNPEQLQLYREILAQNARVRGASFGLPQDSESPKK